MSYGFSKKLIPALVCQKDGGDLKIANTAEADDRVVVEGELVCKQCERKYKISKGIVHFLTEQKEVGSELQDEIRARDKGAHRYDQRLKDRYYKEVVPTVRQLGSLKDKTLIDYGCGTGRITARLSAAKAVLATDFSHESLLYLADKLSSQDNFGLVLADATQLKTKENFFDLGLSSQVLEHVPTKEMRADWLKNIKDTLVLGGKFVCTAYYQDIRRRLKKQPVEGHHPKSNIFFHYFSIGDIKNEFGPIFKINKIKIIDITLPLEVRLGLTRIFKGHVSRLLENVPFIRSLGHLILVVAVKNEKQ